MRLAIMGFVAGASLLQSLPALPAPRSIAGLALAAILMLALRRAWWRTGAGLLLGFCWAALVAQHTLAVQLAKADEGANITVVGVVDSLPYAFERGVRFRFAVEQTRGASAPVPRSVALSWYGGPELRPGERWRLAVRLQRPHGNVNPHALFWQCIRYVTSYSSSFRRQITLFS